MSEESKYENDPRPKGSVVCFAMPGAGGPLLLELMSEAGRSGSVKEQPLEFYQGITLIGESLPLDDEDDLDTSSMGITFYKRNSKKQNTRMVHYYLKNILFKSCTSCGFTVIENLRGDLITRFARVIRSINDTSDNNPIKVAFLTCDLSEVQYDNPVEHNKQIEEFRNASELGDIWIKKSELLSDPIKTMMKVKCANYPFEPSVNKVMEKYRKELA